MPCYVRQCATAACPRYGQPFEVLRRAADLRSASMAELVRCPECGGPSDFHPDQRVAVERTWRRSGDRTERESRTTVFQEAGIEDVKRDCPSMDFKIRDGEAIPVFHNDAHHRRCMREMRTAGERYKAEAEAKRAAKRPKVNKTRMVQEWRKKARL